MPSGSYLALTHPTMEVHREAMEEALRTWNESGAAPMTMRDRQGLVRFFDGLELLEPGVVTCSQWRPEAGDKITVEVTQYGGVGRKP